MNNAEPTATGTASTVLEGANDVFWEQFFTETSGSDDVQQSPVQKKRFRWQTQKEKRVGEPPKVELEKNVDHLAVGKT
ncbi:hypothetical protein BHE74_00033989 [Ensete ventricosum]|uniref:Uncharacterized protein n=1 Tax=Ensete ventricosum TaxID=4639 RepID=A0A445MJV7_ENSVE|nr:hypothetical protein BHE74_00033989 [Ensete ventricosum]RZR74562.1 hypothetical protein BHM03_00038522 [Ensete ventricosum]